MLLQESRDPSLSSLRWQHIPRGKQPKTWMPGRPPHTMQLQAPCGLEPSHSFPPNGAKVDRNTHLRRAWERKGVGSKLSNIQISIEFQSTGLPVKRDQSSILWYKHSELLTHCKALKQLSWKGQEKITKILSRKLMCAGEQGCLGNKNWWQIHCQKKSSLLR